jgi:hypothetical protein
MAGVIEIYSKFGASAVVRFLQEEGVSERMFTARTFSAEGKYLCSATNLKMAKWHCMMIQRNTEAYQGRRTVMEILPLSKV